MVLLINIDSKMPNLALKKIEKFHLDRGDEVVWDMPIFRSVAEKVYVSCIFDWNKPQCDEWLGSEIGGTGFDTQAKLPDEIEQVKPHINIGFTMRGCIRSCPFCVVPLKEGKPQIVGDLLDLWDGESKEVIIFDNNAFAIPSHFKLVCQQARENNIRIDFNQGLDIRLLTDDLASIIKQTPFSTDIRFAWDNIKDEQSIRRGIEILKKHECRRAMFYVLCGFDSSIEEDLYRFEVLKSLGQRAYCMRHKNVRKNRLYNDLASWVNQQRFFNSMDFKRFQECRKDRNLVGKQ